MASQCCCIAFSAGISAEAFVVMTSCEKYMEKGRWVPLDGSSIGIFSVQDGVAKRPTKP